MVWPFSKKKSEEEKQVAQGTTTTSLSDAGADAKNELTNYSKGQKFLLEDTKPRFSSESSSVAAREQERASLKEAWDTINFSDVTVSKVLSIPCFRDAGIGGFTSMFVVGSVMFLYHKNPARAANWGVGGFMLGSIVGWEQCRMRRRRSFQIAAMAKQTVAAKEKPMLHPVKNIDAVKAEWDERKKQAKPWYKFW